MRECEPSPALAATAGTSPQARARSEAHGKHSIRIYRCKGHGAGVIVLALPSNSRWPLYLTMSPLFDQVCPAAVEWHRDHTTRTEELKRCKPTLRTFDPVIGLLPKKSACTSTRPRGRTVLGHGTAGSRGSQEWVSRPGTFSLSRWI